MVLKDKVQPCPQLWTKASGHSEHVTVHQTVVCRDMQVLCILREFGTY